MEIRGFPYIYRTDSTPYNRFLVFNENPLIENFQANPARTGVRLTKLDGIDVDDRVLVALTIQPSAITAKKLVSIATTAGDLSLEMTNNGDLILTHNGTTLGTLTLGGSNKIATGGVSRVALYIKRTAATTISYILSARGESTTLANATTTGIDFGNLVFGNGEDSPSAQDAFNGLMADIAVVLPASDQTTANLSTYTTAPVQVNRDTPYSATFIYIRSEVGDSEFAYRPGDNLLDGAVAIPITNTAVAIELGINGIDTEKLYGFYVVAELNGAESAVVIPLSFLPLRHIDHFSTADGSHGFLAMHDTGFLNAGRDTPGSQTTNQWALSLAAAAPNSSVADRFNVWLLANVSAASASFIELRPIFKER